MADRREGRGQLSSIDLLPDEAQDVVLWALEELNARKRTQADILFEMNDQLEARGLQTISRSAFNRYSVRMAARSRRIIERQQIYAGIAPRLTPERVAETDLVLGEFLKTIIDEALEAPEALSARNAHDLAKAFEHVVKAMKTSAEHKAQLMAEMKTAATRAVDAVAATKGLTDEAAEAIKSKILGIKS
jgi:hypothetical protein